MDEKNYEWNIPMVLSGNAVKFLAHTLENLERTGDVDVCDLALLRHLRTDLARLHEIYVD